MKNCNIFWVFYGPPMLTLEIQFQLCGRHSTSNLCLKKRFLRIFSIPSILKSLKPLFSRTFSRQVVGLTMFKCMKGFPPDFFRKIHCYPPRGRPYPRFTRKLPISITSEMSQISLGPKWFWNRSWYVQTLYDFIYNGSKANNKESVKVTFILLILSKKLVKTGPITSTISCLKTTKENLSNYIQRIIHSCATSLVLAMRVSRVYWLVLISLSAYGQNRRCSETL